MSQQLRVLVVDDCADTADSLGALVTLWGHEAKVAYGGGEALQSAQSFCPHVVLIDLVMPDLNGAEVAERIRTLDAQTVIIAISGHREQAQQQYAQSALFDDYFPKPVGLTELQRLLQSEKARVHQRGSRRHPRERPMEQRQLG